MTPPLPSPAPVSAGFRASNSACLTSIGPPASPKPWLVMVYMAGDNNLTEEMVLALQDLMTEGPPTDDIIVVQFDTSGVGLEAQQFVFTAPNPGPLKGTPIGPVNTGSADALSEFIVEAAKKDPKGDMNWLLVISGHGGGTIGDFLAQDANAEDALSIDELKEALDKAKKVVKRNIDILGMDACFMSMGEVAYEIRDYADILVGAEGLEPAFGWPYRRLLAWAKAGAAAGQHFTPKQLASAIVCTYISHYRDYDATAGRSADLSATDLTRLGPVATAFKSVVDELRTLGPAGHDRVVLAHWYAQTFKFDQYVDVVDLCEQLKRQFDAGSLPALHKACDDVIAAVDVSSPPGSTIATGWSGFAHQHAHGLSIYFPWALMAEDYRKRAFPIDTGWADFVEEHLEATRREGRVCGPSVMAAVIPTSAEEIRRNIAATKARKWDRIRELQRLAQKAEPETDKVAEATRRRLRNLVDPNDPKQMDRMNRTIEAVVLTGVPQVDDTAAISNRLLGARSFRMLHSRFSANTRFSVNTRFSANTRFSENTRSLDSLENSIKNLPLIIDSCVRINHANLP